MAHALTDTFIFAGWSVRYQVLEPYNATPSSTPSQTVVFVHGTPWTSVVFRPLATTLQAFLQCRIVLYDLPGYGESQTLEPSVQKDSNGFAGDTSVKAQASALAALLGHLRCDSEPAVIAHDIAGTIALRAHLLHGVEYKSLMLWDTNCVLPWGDGFYKLVRAKPEVFTELPLPLFEAMARAVTRSACHNPSKLASGWEDALVLPWVSSPEAQRSFVRQIAQANDADVAEIIDQGLYKKVRCDVKIMWGEQDAWIPREKMETFAGMVKHCLKEFVVVPEAGHLVMIDQPERVTAEVISWLSRSS